MKKIAKQVKNYTPKVNIINNNNLSARLLNFMFFSFGMLVLSYVFIMSNIIVNITERKTLEANARTISNEVGELELQYLTLVNDIDLDMASKMGFVETKTNFATRKALGSANTNSHEL